MYRTAKENRGFFYINFGMLLFDMASESDQELLYVECGHPATNYFIRYPLVNHTTVQNNQIVAATHTPIHGYPLVYCNPFANNQQVTAIHHLIHGYPSVYCNSFANNQLVAASHGLFGDLMPRRYNWFGLKILFYPIFWILRNIYYAGEYATRTIFSYTSKKRNDPIILFFKRMICTCKKFQQVYMKQNTLYELLEKIINNGTQFIFNDLSEINLFYNEIRNQIFKKQLPDIQSVNCWSIESSLLELERSKNEVKIYIEGIDNVSEYHKKDLLRRLEIVMTHFKFIEKVLNFKKIVHLQKYTQFFDWKTQQEDKKDIKLIEQELMDEFTEILSLITEKKIISETIANINNELDQNLSEEQSAESKQQNHAEQAENPADRLPKSPTSYAEQAENPADRLPKSPTSYAEQAENPVFAQNTNLPDNPDLANQEQSVNNAELTSKLELDKQSNP